MRARGAATALLAVLAAMGLAVPTPARALSPRPIEFPAPELDVTVAPLPLGVARPPLELPPTPPATAPALDLGGAPLPRFATTVAKPLPAVKDPGGFRCAFVAFRRAETLAECGVHRIYQQDVRGAREVLEESVAIEPRDPPAATAHVWLGEVALLEARYDQAERRYRAAVQLGPPPELAPHAELGLGLLALRRGDLVEARRALGQALAHVPPQPVALVARYLDGVARVLDDQAAEALGLWDVVAASGAGPGMVEELLFWRGVALARLGEPERAVQHLERFLSAVPTTHPLRADAIAQLGWVALERGVAGEAERQFRLAERAGPRPELRPQLLAGLVRASLALGDGAGAASAARRLAIEAPRDPLVAPALLLVADVAGRRGARGEALDVYRQLRALPLVPALRDYATYRLADGLEQEGRLAEARGLYRDLRDSGRDEALAQRASYRLGLLALREQDPTAARREGEALLRAGTLPELRGPALLLTAEGAARAGDPNRAVALLSTALQEAPGSPRATAVRLALGWARFADGEPESALREWQEVLRAADLETRALAALAIAEVALRQGHEAQALSALRQLTGLPVTPALAELVAVDHGVLAVRTGADQEAVQALDPLAPRLAEFTRQALVRRALGIARYRLRQYDLAERHFRVAAHAAAEPSSWLGAALAALPQNRLAEAEDAFNRAWWGATAEVGASASYGLVVVAVRRGDGEAFRERSITFVDRYPAHRLSPVVLYALVATMLERGDLDQGEAWVRRLLRDHPKSDYGADALMRLTVATAEARPAVARQAYRDLLDRSRTPEVRAEAWVGLAETALRLGDGPGAQQAAEEFLREAPSADARAARAQLLLVRAHEAQGRRDEAVRAAEGFLARFPDDPAAPGLHLTRGRLLAEERRFEAAQPSLEAARDRGDATVAAPAHFWLGEVLRSRGEHEAAIVAYLGAAYLYPGTPWAARGLQGAAQSYVARQMPREAGIVLRKLAATPGVEPALAQWAHQALVQLGPAARGEPPRVAPRP